MKTDGPHTSGFTATDWFPGACSYTTSTAPTTLFENPSAQLSEMTVSLRLRSCRDLRTGSDPLVTSVSASRSRCRVAGDVAE